MERLHELVDTAIERPLTGTEINELTSVAIQSGLVEHVVSVLLTTGPKAAYNLRYAPRLKLEYSKIMHSRPIRSSARKFLPIMNSKVGFTIHAIERFVRRCAPYMSLSEAEQILSEEAATAIILREKTRSGQERWKIKSGAVLIVKRYGWTKIPTCVTIVREKTFDGSAPN